jgi:hypothetical protein
VAVSDLGLRAARHEYIAASVEGSLSVRSFVTGTCGEAFGRIAAYEYLCLAYVLADRYTSSEKHRPLQHDFVMQMANEAAERIADATRDESGRSLEQLERQIDLNWRNYRRVRSGNRDSSELVREFVSHLIDSSPQLDDEQLAELVQRSLLTLPLGELIEECEELGFEHPPHTVAC